MSEKQDISIDQLYKRVEMSSQPMEDINSFIKNKGEGAQKVGLSIDGATTELNILLKSLFLVKNYNPAEYQLLAQTAIKHLESFFLIINNRFGTIPPSKLKEEDGK